MTREAERDSGLAPRGPERGKAGRVLVVEDDPSVRDYFVEVLQGHVFSISVAATLREGLDAAATDIFDVVFLDVLLPDGSGLDFIGRFRDRPTRPEVIIMTAQGDPHGAALALQHGAWDYLCKPLSVYEIRLAVTRAMEYRGATQCITPGVFTIADFVSTAPAMAECLRAAAQAAASDLPVLITGETGTGKERLARGIHDNSSRAPHAFVVVDCTVIPESLVESHLFGHEKGAFTGADRQRPGLVQLAHNGTLFLDEVGDLPLGAQAKLLRLLQEKTFRPLGAKDEMFSNFRLVAATHRPLEALVKEGRFREDLYHRMSGIKVALPPLRERKEDILPLVQDILRREAQRSGGELKGLSPDFVETVLQYSWPGNVRELIHAVLHALAFCGNAPTLFAAHLPEPIRLHVVTSRIPPKDSSPLQEGAPSGLEKTMPPCIWEGPMPVYKDYREKILAWAARRYLEELRKRCGQDLRQACRMSGLSRSRLYALMKEAGAQKEDAFSSIQEAGAERLG